MSSQRVAGKLEQLRKRLDRLVEVERAAPLRDFSVYRDDPVRFAEEVLGVRSATRRSDLGPYQFELLRAIQAYPRVAIRAGHGVGKTTLLAMAALWWLVTRPLSRVVICAPQFERQVRGVVFGELRKLVRRARLPVPVEVLQGKATVNGYGSEWGMVGLPATEPDRIEGQHAEGGLLLIMDETKGVSQECFDALMGALTGGEDSRLVVASTPGGVAGPFYRACVDARGLWQVWHLSAEDSSLVSPSWCADRAAEWGRESALYVSRVQGQFADAGEGQLFGLSLLEHATQVTVPPSTEVMLGVDVARSVAGDQNCICVARGGRVERFILWRSPDLMATVARVVHEAMVTHPKLIRVDEGGVGGGLVDRLRQLHFRVEGVNFGGAARDAARFRNARAELYWQLRERLEQEVVRLPEDEDLAADLTALRYTFTQDGKILLESKDEARRRLGRSPDRADALVLAVGPSRLSPALPVLPLSIPLQPFSGFDPGDEVGVYPLIA